ncbi:hypothetical protein ACFVXC_00045 [Streptomyces sp. NPDC058257]|uniref:hypothetical protein n=1 Tax=Streptomyces sp. NPDC058257 TaxID=3346409 RepID=UPI0036ED7E39
MPGQGHSHDYSRSEATRLLCAGAYVHGMFRRKVIEELIEHEERSVAPSLGIDVTPVLAHALRARRLEAQASVQVLLIWVLFIVVELNADVPSLLVPWFVVYAVIVLLAWSARLTLGARSLSVYTLDRATLRRASSGRLTVLAPIGPRLFLLAYWVAALFLALSDPAVLLALLFPLLLVLPVWLHRSRVEDIMRHELSSDAFSRVPRALPQSTLRLRRITAAIDREQYAPLTFYDPYRPFVGAGRPYEPWSFALELRRRVAPDGSRPAADRLLARTVVDLIVPRLERLCASAAATGRDRLRDLEIDEFVYLPVGPARGRVSYDALSVQRHLAEAVDEGGEARRHFLRIRIGAWDEQVVVSILVRVHTQGEMLVLEVIPHILMPLSDTFRIVDVVAARDRPDVGREAVRALLAAPAASVAAGASAIRTLIALFRVWLADPRRAIPDGPETSVREQGSAEQVSLMQEMDISRYVKTVQDRIISGVREALRTQGYETGEFEQQIVNVSSGGVFVGAMSGGAVATGDRASAHHSSRPGPAHGNTPQGTPGGSA